MCTFALLLACGGSFLAFLDVTITNLAVPDLAGDFSVGVTSLSWVVTLYTILRTTQMRRFRLPAPQIKRFEDLPEKY